MTYVLLDKNTGHRVGEATYTFSELQDKVEREIEFFVKSFLNGANKSTIRRELTHLKNRTENLIFSNDSPNQNSSPTVWSVMKVSLLNLYIEKEFDKDTAFIYQRLISRFADALKENFVIVVADFEKLNSLGIYFTSARIYDSNLSSNIIIVTQDQLNYLKLFYPEEEIRHITDVSKVKDSLRKVGFE